MDFSLEDFVGSVFPAWRNLSEIDTHRLVHEWDHPVKSLLAKAAILSGSHDDQPLSRLHNPDSE